MSRTMRGWEADGLDVPMRSAPTKYSARAVSQTSGCQSQRFEYMAAANADSKLSQSKVGQDSDIEAAMLG